MASAIRRTINKNCGGSKWCFDANMTHSLSEADNEIINVESILGIKAQKPKYEILRLIPNKNQQLEFVKV